MALYEITVIKTSVTNGIRLEKGMSVEVACLSNPVSHNGGTLIHEAFLRKYGIDSKKADALTPGRYTAKKIGT
jgi:shikimate 5-dehydrogenase